MINSIRRELMHDIDVHMYRAIKLIFIGQLVIISDFLGKKQQLFT